MDEQHIELLAQIAGYYYLQDLKQEEIARRTGYSRSMVSRLLSEARDAGIVQVTVNFPQKRCRDLEDALVQTFNLRTVRVLARGTLGHDQMLRKLGMMAARLVEELVASGAKKIGVSWGASLTETVSALHRLDYADTRVYQIVGSAGAADPEVDGPEVARRLAEALGGQYVTIPAPLLVDKPATRDALLRTAVIERIRSEAANLDLALSGISSMDPSHSSWVRSGFVEPRLVEILQEEGVVGDVCGIVFGKDGKIIEDSAVKGRIVGIGRKPFNDIPMRLGVAGGDEKALPILGACRAKLVNALVTDEVAALAVLQYSREVLESASADAH